MSEPVYERLTPLDASFLALENDTAQMHVASLGLLEAPPLTRQDGELDIERIERALAPTLERHPRMRRKLWWPPGAPPVWIDDPEFRMGYHLRHTALPRPGTMRQLKRMAGRILSQTLDRTKPLWELWVIEGLEGERLALLAKLHHALADGIAAREILTSYLSFAPAHDPPAAHSWKARPAPGIAQLHLDEAMRRTAAAMDLLGRAPRALACAAELPGALGRGASGLLGALGSALDPASVTSLNRPVGAHRRVDCTRCDLRTVQQVARAAGGKLNDAVLAVVTGALRRFLLQRGEQVDELEFRILVPVNARARGEHGAPGNRVSNLIVPVPLAETDPRRRLERIIRTTARLKASYRSEVTALLGQLADRAGLFLPRFVGQRVAPRLPGANLIVTNIPGPTETQYLLDSALLESYPFVPLTAGHCLGVALYTYRDALHWGLQADWDSVPDLHDFATAIDAEVGQLLAASAPVVLRHPAGEANRPGDAKKPGETKSGERSARRRRHRGGGVSS